uniref:nuclear factor of activated T-cells, cytoplasmic 1-like n=1 Tax=Myxine glutinosa TaxID=7769 RepID=UPI00358EE30F
MSEIFDEDDFLSLLFADVSRPPPQRFGTPCDYIQASLLDLTNCNGLQEREAFVPAAPISPPLWQPPPSIQITQGDVTASGNHGCPSRISGSRDAPFLHLVMPYGESGLVGDGTVDPGTTWGERGRSAIETYREAPCSSPSRSLSPASCKSDASGGPLTTPDDVEDCELALAAGNIALRYVSPHGSRTPSPPPYPAYNLSPWPSPRASPRHSLSDEHLLGVHPGVWPGSRPGSPSGKRRRSTGSCFRRSPSPQCSPFDSPHASPHTSPCASPHASPRGSVTEDNWLGISSPEEEDPANDLPLKTRRCSQEFHPPNAEHQPVDGANESNGLSPLGGQNTCPSPGPFLTVPHFSWYQAKPVPPQRPPPTSPQFQALQGSEGLPPLEWPLPSASGGVELQLEVQPRPHHRAHYETEGSRGAVKAVGGSHPVVSVVGYSEGPLALQVFIATSDERPLRAHPFYQVHRVTGKSVATPSREIVIGSTKVLELPLLPQDGMRAAIDCAGILKLRNSDIELRRGETDVGRKNTRVRLAFRTAIPQPGSAPTGLLVASTPIECSQRSAQELPVLDSLSPVMLPPAGTQLTLRGANFSSDSRVVLTQRRTDGQALWETEVKVEKENFKPYQLIVTVPPYPNQHGHLPSLSVHVETSRHRQSLPLTFTPSSHAVNIKTEPPSQLSHPLSICAPSSSPLHGSTPVLEGSPPSALHSQTPPTFCLSPPTFHGPSPPTFHGPSPPTFHGPSPPTFHGPSPPTFHGPSPTVLDNATPPAFSATPPSSLIGQPCVHFPSSTNVQYCLSCQPGFPHGFVSPSHPSSGPSAVKSKCAAPGAEPLLVRRPGIKQEAENMTRNEVRETSASALDPAAFTLDDLHEIISRDLCETTTSSLH